MVFLCNIVFFKHEDKSLALDVNLDRIVCLATTYVHNHRLGVLSLFSVVDKLCCGFTADISGESVNIHFLAFVYIHCMLVWTRL